jgi:hypothetical protein
VAAAPELASGRPERHRRHLRERGIDLGRSGVRVCRVRVKDERETSERRGAGRSGRLGQAWLGRSSRTWWSSPARLNGFDPIIFVQFFLHLGNSFE